VIGIAGEVKDNCCFTTNIPHWRRTEGNSIA
jgi:glucokinase